MRELRQYQEEMTHRHLSATNGDDEYRGCVEQWVESLTLDRTMW